MNAYVLTGGESTRVRSLTEAHECAKHELPINGHQFYSYMGHWLGSSTIVADDGIRILNRPVVGTGGAIKDSNINHYPYLIVYGDCYSPIDILDVYNTMLDSNADMVIITRLTSEADYGLITVDDDRVIKYTRKHSTTGEYMTNIGTYLIDRRAHEYIVNQPWNRVPGNYLHTMSLEYNVFDTIFDHLTILNYDSTNLPYYDVGTPDRYEATCRTLGTEDIVE